tara:strand:+ start:194 stop:1024 length:831 start_codon:yes stop_codon:yes gene_type:complete
MAIIEPFALTIAFVLSYVFDIISSYGFSIVILTVFINIIIFPLTLRQTRSTKRMQDAQPELQKLQKQHKDNKEELNKAVAELYKEKGINPFGCIFPLIVQMPIWFALFRVLREPLVFLPEGSNIGAFLSGNPPLFYRMDLQIPPSEAGTLIEKAPYLVLVLLVVLTALYQQKQITRKSDNPNNPQAKQMQTIGKIMPLFFGFISWTLPAGLVVYFLTGNIFRIGQQSLIVKLEDRDGKEGTKEEKKQNDKEDDVENSVEEETESRRKNRKKRKRRK